MRRVSANMRIGVQPLTAWRSSHQATLRLKSTVREIPPGPGQESGRAMAENDAGFGRVEFQPRKALETCREKRSLVAAVLFLARAQKEACLRMRRNCQAESRGQANVARAPKLGSRGESATPAWRRIGRRIRFATASGTLALGSSRGRGSSGGLSSAALIAGTAGGK